VVNIITRGKFKIIIINFVFILLNTLLFIIIVCPWCGWVNIYTQYNPTSILIVEDRYRFMGW